jgi:aquaporin Z
MNRRFLAEAFGTAWLVIGGCGTAVLAGSQVGWLGVSLAFGLTVVTMAYAIGPISGCHLNPAVTIGLAAAGRFPSASVAGYVLAQVLGGLLGACVVLVMAQGATGGYEVHAAGLASNGYGEVHGGFSLTAALITEIVMTAFFLLVILGATSKGASPGFAGLAIGLALTLIHLISIRITNTSVNPARSTGPALLAQGVWLEQLWLFWVAPIAGAVLGALLWRSVGSAARDE